MGVEPAALRKIIYETRGYPYFLQEWGKHAWDVAGTSPITALDVEAGSREAIAALDESFFRVRFDRLTPVEKRYLRAMADIGPGPHRSGDVAQRLGRKVTSLGPTRNQLISKGMIWSPSHGDTAFTVPLFDEFMRRIMPGDDWKEGWLDVVFASIVYRCGGFGGGAFQPTEASGGPTTLQHTTLEGNRLPSYHCWWAMAAAPPASSKSARGSCSSTGRRGHEVAGATFSIRMNL